MTATQAMDCMEAIAAVLKVRFNNLNAVELAAINSSTSPYTNTIIGVSREMLTDEEFQQAGYLPGCALWDNGEDEPDAMSNQQRICRVRFTVITYYGAQPGAGTSSALGNSLAGDVLVAMAGSTNRTHNNTCINTFYKGFDKIDTAEGLGVGAVMQKFEAVYNATWDAP